MRPLELISAEQALADISAHAATLGVGVQAEFDDFQSDIYISDIGRDISNPATKGSGAVVLGMICDLADRHELTVSISHMTDEPGLGSYYGRFGFLPESEPELITNMLRPAAASTERAIAA